MPDFSRLYTERWKFRFLFAAPHFAGADRCPGKVGAAEDKRGKPEHGTVFRRGLRNACSAWVIHGLMGRKKVHPAHEKKGGIHL